MELLIDWDNEANIKKYLGALASSDKPYRHSSYYKNIAHAEELAVHMYGALPKELLTSYRPNEPKEVHNYRMSIFKPITKSKCKKIVNVLSRINNAKNYEIRYPEPTVAGAKDENSLKNYLEKEYPFFGNFTRWVFEVALKQMLADPNSAVCFIPKNLAELSDEGGDTKYPEPFGYTYPSRQLVDFMPDHYYVFLKDEKSAVNVTEYGKGKEDMSGAIFSVFTQTQILTYTQYGNKEDNLFRVELVYQHNIGEPPVVVLGGEYVENTYPFAYESFISGVVPYWDDALREFSDKQAVFVQHVYPERVEIQVECDNTQCGKNANIGWICDGDKRRRCERCQGTGKISGRGPFGVTSVKKDSFDHANPIFPGVAYVDIPTDIVELLKKDIDELIFDGYAAINMEFLAETPEAQSGVAKAYDRSELTSFLLMVSNNVFDNIIKYSIEFMNSMRYNNVMTPEQLEEQLPKIVKPTDFDILSLNQIIAGFSQNQTLPSTIKDEMVLEIIEKKFPEDEKKQEFYRSIILLDPLRGKTADDKFTAFSNGVITKEDYIISENIYKFVSQAIEADADFIGKTDKEKYDALIVLAKAQIALSEKKIELFEEEEEEEIEIPEVK